MECVPIVLLMQLEDKFFRNNVHYAHKTQQITYIRYCNNCATECEDYETSL